MHRQIEQALENMSALSQEKSKAIRNILSNYVKGEIELDEAYYELMDNDLIPMPKDVICFQARNITGRGENFKNYIKMKLS